MRRYLLCAALLLTTATVSAAQEAEFPRIVRSEYEAIDPKLGGQFLMWSERERVFYGLDPKLYPGAKNVKITQVTPGMGTTLTYVEITTTTSKTPDYLYMTGGTRFRISGMTMKSSNFPGTGMQPQP